MKELFFNEYLKKYSTKFMVGLQFLILFAHNSKVQLKLQNRIKEKIYE